MRRQIRLPILLATAFTAAALWPLGAAPLVPCSACDTTFGTDGLATNLGIGPGLGVEVAVQDDGKALLALNQHIAGTAAVARVNVDGSLDASFGTGGVVQLTFDSDSDEESAFGVAIAPDLDGDGIGGPFDIVVGGRFQITTESSGGGGGRGNKKPQTSTESYLAVARLNADGSAIAGLPPVTLQPEATQPGDQAIRVDSAGDILVAGRTGSSSLVFRVSSDLSVVSTSEAVSGAITGLRVDSLDRVIGQISNLDRIVRWTADGLLDPAFGIGGVVEVELPRRIAVDAADGVLVAARVRYSSGRGRNKTEWDQIEIVRYDETGTLDTGFSTLVFDPRTVNDGRTVHEYDLEIDPEGRIVVALEAFEEDGNTRASHVVRWDMGTQEVFTYEPPLEDTSMYSIAFGPNGIGEDTMTLGGWDRNGPDDSIPALVRLFR